MAARIPDEAFARTVNEMGAVTLEQLEQAKLVQTQLLEQQPGLALADVLVQQGLMTTILRENVEKRIQAQQAGGITQLGQYKIIKKVGEGGMGAVYLAEDTRVGRKVALKVLPKKFAADQNFLSRFRREAKATGRLNHANIVTAYNSGEDMGVHFYAMEFCDGEPLDAKLKREKTLPWDQAVGIAIQVARGLKHAHEHDLIHRDIKPANIFLTKNGIAKILDLGLSKNIGDTEQSFATQTGTALGTPHYISPEQACGDNVIDGRTDIYSLGATLYHLVTGQTPFQGSTAALIMMQHITGQLPNPQDLRADLPDGIVQVIRKMMAKEPADRYRDCGELLSDLELVQDGKPPATPGLSEDKSSVALLKSQHPPRRPAPEVLVATVALSAKKASPLKLYLLGETAAAAILLAGVFAYRWSGRKSEAAPKSAENTLPAQTVVSPSEAKTTVASTSIENTPTTQTVVSPSEVKTAAVQRADVKLGEPKELSLNLGDAVKMELVRIPAGTFQMGSPAGERERGNDELQHMVTIGHAFYMGKYTVTQEQYAAVTGKTPSEFKGLMHPVETVSWNDAQAFCKTLQSKVQTKLPPGLEVQLPTEAQWEFACRAGTKTRFYSGDASTDLDRVAWYTSNSDAKTHPVGQKTPNALGLYDMHGNVLQWCQDAYRKD